MICYVGSGGGAKTSFQVGCMKALSEYGIDRDVTRIVGTSGGALNALGYSYLPPGGLEGIWRGIKANGDILKSNWWKLGFSSGLKSTKPLRKILKDIVDGYDPTITCQSVYYDLAKHELKLMDSDIASDEQMVDGTLASASIPGEMDAVGDWVDGGVVSQIPIFPAIGHGPEKKYIVFVSKPLEEFRSESFEKKWPYWWSYAKASIDVMSNDVYWNDVRHCDVLEEEFLVIEPEKVIIDTLDFNPDKIAWTIDHGYEVMNKVIDQGGLEKLGL